MDLLESIRFNIKIIGYDEHERNYKAGRMAML